LPSLNKLGLILWPTKQINSTKSGDKMKLKKNVYSLVPYVIFVLLAGVPTYYADSSSEETTAKEVKKEMQDLLKTLKSYTAEQRDEAVEKTEKALEKLDKRINALEARIDKNWNTMTQTAREEARANMKALRKQRTQVAEWYGSMKNSSASAWEHMKQGFSDAYKKLEETWEKSEKEFDSEK
jgi:nitrogen fixation/metabolism regulation signal transduction histidine kinase